ncbi:MAG: hypothetical protein E7618_08515 [Ruminococcaceae bacterium]|nr:hypothetical protein [Oscillospiraceae bacterium]
MNAPVFTGTWGSCHIQGIAVDRKHGFLYYSFTTMLVKAKLDGTVIGSVDGLVGHLGCIAFCEADGCVYGSLEYKNDAIGKGILHKTQSELSFSDAFYLVRFDVEKIDRFHIPAENSDIMTAVYLKEVADDYHGTGLDTDGKTVAHRYGCSGIDGVTFGPIPGQSEADGMYLYVAYGIYADINRRDNDRQILLCYDPGMWKDYAAPLNQKAMHHKGPIAPLHKYFVYTGNTTYGVQNLEYDRFTKAFYMAVYKGKKPCFPNYALFAVDAGVPAKRERIDESDELVEVLTLTTDGQYDEASGVYGWQFPFGATGLYSFGDGRWLISHPEKRPDGQCAHLYPYRWDKSTPFGPMIPIAELKDRDC